MIAADQLLFPHSGFRQHRRCVDAVRFPQRRKGAKDRRSSGAAGAIHQLELALRAGRVAELLSGFAALRETKTLAHAPRATV
jgi:hypothetical protein